MNLDKFMTWSYDYEQRNCLHFAGAVWLELTGDSRLNTLANEFTFAENLPVAKILDRFKGMMRVDKNHPRSIALMNDPIGDLHVGIVINRRLLHLTNSGPNCFDLSVHNGVYKNMRFYA